MQLPWLIVDGYNVIGAEQGLIALDPEDLDSAREALVSRVASLARDSYRAVVVFDAAANPRSEGIPHHVAGVAVIFTRAGQDADEVIERLARRARERGERVTVATSDAQTQWTVLGEGALRMSAAELLSLLADDTAESAEHATRGGLRSTLQDRIEADARERLARWARGER